MLHDIFVDRGRPASLMTRVLRVSLVLSICAVFVVIALEELNKAKRLNEWQQVPCRITSSSVESRGSGFNRQVPYHFQVTYEYTFASQQFVAASGSEDGTDDAADAYANVRRYSRDPATICYVNPSSPSEASLTRTATSTAWLGVWGSCAGTAAVIVFYGLPQLIFYHPKHLWLTTAPRKSTTAFRSGLVMLSIFGPMTIWLWIFPIVRQLQTTAWKPHAAKVVESNVIEHHHDGEAAFSAYRSDIHYTYQVDGQTYHSNCFNLTEGATLFGSLRREFCDRYPVGAMTECFVNPGNPSQAVLSRHISPGVLTGIWCALLSLLGAVGVLFGRIQGLKQKAKRKRSPVPFLAAGAIVVMIVMVGQLVSP